MTAKFRPPQHIAFRTDASIQIGTGHVMRCLTLANALAEHGAQCVFISRVHEGNLNELIKAQGHEVLALPALQAVAEPPGDSPAHAQWLGTSWERDADETLGALGQHVVDWLVVDHYALDVRWEKTLYRSCLKLMVIDDLADRRHACDVLLDQSLGRAEADYLALSPKDCTLLTGPRYALLRPEFSALRDESLARRHSGKLDQLLITMGGVDKDNVTSKVLEALDVCGDYLPANLRITVIMGPHAPWREQVRALAARMPWPTQVAVGVTDMAKRMADADLAIGAAGSTSWERCCLGLPSFQVVLAENQKAIAQALLEAEAALAAPVDALADAVRNLFADRNLNRRITSLSLAASAVTDGRGTQRVIEKLTEGLH